jgi:hypothetical protein
MEPPAVSNSFSTAEALLGINELKIEGDDCLHELCSALDGIEYSATRLGLLATGREFPVPITQEARWTTELFSTLCKM